MNQQLADGLKEKASRLAYGPFQNALFIAAKNIRTHPEEIWTDTEALQVKCVGLKVVAELKQLGLATSTSRQSRMLVQGMEAAAPQKRQRAPSTASAPPSTRDWE